jgi:hypothetical protein
MSQAKISILTLSVIATAAALANRCMTTAGAYPAAGGLALGVNTADAVIGQPTPVDVLGTTLVQAGAAVAIDAKLMVGTDGKVITHDNDGDKHAVGRALTAAAADGDTIEILLVPSTGLLVTAV